MQSEYYKHVLGMRRGDILEGEKRELGGGGQYMLAPLVRFLMDLTVGSLWPAGGFCLASYTIGQSHDKWSTHRHKRTNKIYCSLIKRKRDSNYIKRDKRFDKGISHYFPAKYSNHQCNMDVFTC
jgi:hypothetical protein